MGAGEVQVMLAVLLTVMAVQPAADADGLTPLMRAAARGDVAQVTSLLAGGADVNQAHAELRLTPLMFAAYFGRDAVVALLLEKGAGANLKDAVGASAADWAAQRPPGRGRSPWQGRRATESVPERGHLAVWADGEGRQDALTARAAGKRRSEGRPSL